MDKEKGKQDAQGGKHTQFGKKRKTAETEDQKGDNRRDHAHKTDSAFTSCAASLPVVSCGTVEKKQIGNTMINGNGYNGPAKPEHYNGDGRVE